MKTQYLFPLSVIGLSLGASVVYLIKGDIRHALYFLFGACITASATF